MEWGASGATHEGAQGGKQRKPAVADLCIRKEGPEILFMLLEFNLAHCRRGRLTESCHGLRL